MFLSDAWSTWVVQLFSTADNWIICLEEKTALLHAHTLDSSRRIDTTKNKKKSVRERKAQIIHCQKIHFTNKSHWNGRCEIKNEQKSLCWWTPFCEVCVLRFAKKKSRKLLFFYFVCVCEAVCVCVIFDYHQFGTEAYLWMRMSTQIFVEKFFTYFFALCVFKK